MHFTWIWFHADVADTRIGERGGEVPRAAADVEQRATSRRFAVRGPPEVAHQRDGVGCERAVEAGRVALFVAELRQQPDRAAQVARRANTSVTATGQP